MCLSRLLFVLVAIAGGYIVSVPLFGHKYGILAGGVNTYILSPKDAEACNAALIKSVRPTAPIAIEPGELPPADVTLAEPHCRFQELSAVAWGWFYLPRALVHYRSDRTETSFAEDIASLFTSKSSWEILTGMMIAGAALRLFSFLAARVFP
jgi:hypothetical protein